MNSDNIPLKLTPEKILDGNNPIVIIGPNGSGKTRFGVGLLTHNQAEFIGALRNISLDDNIPMQSLEQATRDLTNAIHSQHSHYWNLSSEINHLFAKLLAEDSASAVIIRDKLYFGQQPTVETTKLMQLRAVWHEFFPGREIRFETYSPKVQSKMTSSPVEYAAKQMSDGERVALYLGARVLNAQPKLIIIDEPEVHFHSRLAVRFWNAMQKLRPDLRFVYITHDLSFALSRQDAQFVIIRSNLVPEIVPLSNGLPKDVAESILGAASFSIHANRIVFCEGDEGSDYSIYANWFNTPDTSVIPVGGCKDVFQCTYAFNNQAIVTGVTAIGIVDRDYWPEQYLKSLPQSVVALPVHELENIYCLPAVYTAIGKYLSLNQSVLKEKYNQAITQAKARFKEQLLAKQLVERLKRRFSGGLETVINKLPVNDDLDALQQECVTALNQNNWDFSPEAAFREERKLLEDALSSSDIMQFLELFPGKVFLKIFTNSLGFGTSAYKELVNNALVANDDSNLCDLKKELVSALSVFLPPRQ